VRLVKREREDVETSTKKRNEMDWRKRTTHTIKYEFWSGKTNRSNTTTNEGSREFCKGRARSESEGEREQKERAAARGDLPYR
jgi:hypothetical protein